MIKPCPFCESQPEYHEHIEFASHHIGCIALAWLECPTCLNLRGKSEVRRTIDWRNQEIIDQIHMVWPNMKLAYEHCKHGLGWLTIGDNIDPVVKRAIAPILKAAVIALWNNRPGEPRLFPFNLKWTADRAWAHQDPQQFHNERLGEPYKEDVHPEPPRKSWPEESRLDGHNA